MQKVNGLQSAPPGFPNLNMFHPVDFVIPVGPVFAYVSGESTFKLFDRIHLLPRKSL